MNQPTYCYPSMHLSPPIAQFIGNTSACYSWNPKQRLELVRDFVKHEIDDKNAYFFAIHNQQNSIEGEELPNTYIIMSRWMNDGIR